MIYNLQLIYENRKYYHTESFIETNTLYESPFNSYIMYCPTEDKILDEKVRLSISDVLTPDRRDDVNGYVIDILLVNDSFVVDIINQQNICETLIRLPIDQVKGLGKMIFNKMRKIQVKNKWLAHLDIVQHNPDIIDSAKRITMDIYGLGKDFEYLKNNGPHSFRYLAKNVDTYLVQVSDDEYELRIPRSITVIIRKETN